MDQGNPLKEVYIIYIFLILYNAFQTNSCNFHPTSLPDYLTSKPTYLLGHRRMSSKPYLHYYKQKTEPPFFSISNHETTTTAFARWGVRTTVALPLPLMIAVSAKASCTSPLQLNSQMSVSCLSCSADSDLGSQEAEKVENNTVGIFRWQVLRVHGAWWISRRQANIFLACCETNSLVWPPW